MKTLTETQRLGKINRLSKEKAGLHDYIADLEKTNKYLYETLKDQSVLSATKADEASNKIIYNTGEIESTHKKIRKIQSRIVKLTKKYY